LRSSKISDPEPPLRRWNVGARFIASAVAVVVQGFLTIGRRRSIDDEKKNFLEQ